jgi:hypothetical protein
MCIFVKQRDIIAKISNSVLVKRNLFPPNVYHSLRIEAGIGFRDI